MLRHIAWFNEALIEPHPAGGLVTSDPSVERRCLTPARELEYLGVECSVFGNLSDADPHQVRKHLQKLDTDIVVIGRLSEPSRLKLARAAKHLGCYVIADFCDERVISPELLKLAEIADQIVASTDDTAKLAARETGQAICVIPDCGENIGEAPAKKVAHLWLDCFKQLKLKPPASANTNDPQAGPIETA